MTHEIIVRVKKENANSLVENVIILPFIFLTIYFMIMTAFILHDRATLDAAAKRGTIYAARCISDPNYEKILIGAGHQAGELDTSITDIPKESFKNVGNNIHPYRYLKLDSSEIKNTTTAEVSNIIQKTKIPWREIQTEDIVVDIDNKVIYQKVTVDITARYPLPQIFGIFGFPTEFEYTVSATTAVNDPDEFIRNVDLVIDTFVQIDQKTGGKISNVTDRITDTISNMANKIKDFLEVHN